jgi:hypothetical protein
MESVLVRCSIAHAAPDLEHPQLSLISYVNPIDKYLAFEPRSRTKSQLYSQGNEKFNTKTKFKKQTNGSIMCRNLRSIEWYQKTYVQIS